MEKGFCDSIMFEAEPQTVIENARKVIVNSVPLDLSRFKTVPTMLLNSPAQGGLQNTIVLDATVSSAFQCGIAARASGIGADEIARLPLRHYLKIKNAARDFLVAVGY